MPSATEGRKKLREIISRCNAVEERRLPAFDVHVRGELATTSEFFDAWDSVEDLSLDARVLNGLSRVLQVQAARIEYEASLFLADPQMLADKVAKLPPATLAAVFLATWHPAVELEQLTPEGLDLALRYWEEMPSWAARHHEEPELRPPPPRPMTDEELAALGILSREGFLAFLGALWDELKAMGSVAYWDFVRRARFEETVRRAYGVSFLVSYGYADLESTEGPLTLSPKPEKEHRGGSESLAISLGVDRGG